MCEHSEWRSECRPDRRVVSSFEFSMEYKLFMHSCCSSSLLLLAFFFFFRSILCRRAHVKYIDIWKTFIIIIHALRARTHTHTHQASLPLYLSFRYWSQYLTHMEWNICRYYLSHTRAPASRCQRWRRAPEKEEETKGRTFTYMPGNCSAER